MTITMYTSGPELPGQIPNPDIDGSGQDWFGWAVRTLPATARWACSIGPHTVFLIVAAIAALAFSGSPIGTAGYLALAITPAWRATQHAYRYLQTIRPGDALPAHSLPAFLMLVAAGWLFAAIVVAAVVIVAVCAAVYVGIRIFIGGESTTTGTTNIGDVWMVEVPNDNPAELERFKVRPAVIVCSSLGNYTVLWTTSQTHRAGQFGYIDVATIAGWPRTARPGTSYLNTNSPLTIRSSAFRQWKGQLPGSSVELLRPYASPPRS